MFRTCQPQKMVQNLASLNSLKLGSLTCFGCGKFWTQTFQRVARFRTQLFFSGFWHIWGWKEGWATLSTEHRLSTEHWLASDDTEYTNGGREGVIAAGIIPVTGYLRSERCGGSSNRVPRIHIVEAHTSRNISTIRSLCSPTRCFRKLTWHFLVRREEGGMSE